MTPNQSNKKTTFWRSIIILLSIIGLMVCIAVLFPQVRRMIVDLAIRVLHKEPYSYQTWLKTLWGYAMGGICFILLFDYCTLFASGRALVQKVKQDMKDCLSEINFRPFVKPVLVMFGVYLLGFLTIIRANFLYLDDLIWAVTGHRDWYNWSRYMVVFLSYFVQPEIRMTDISPLPQLLAALILSICSVLLVYIIGNKKITAGRLLASIPLGLSPCFLEGVSLKFAAPYFALSILVSIVPFLFIARKKAFFFCSIVFLLIMCMIYQAASGIYLLIVVILCFQDWNSRRKSNKEIGLFLGTAAFAFCLAMLVFKFFLMKPVVYYASTEMHPLHHMIGGILDNIKNYAMTINHDWSIIWKTGIVFVLFFFITQSVHQSTQKKLVSFLVSVLVIGISFILSFGVYLLLTIPLFAPRALLGFGVFLAGICIYVVSDYKKLASVFVLALNWCLFTFAFSYGNALADQARYAEFRISIVLHDLSALYPNVNREDISIQFDNSIDFTPSVKNIAKHNPVIEKLVPKRLGKDTNFDAYYCLEYFNFGYYSNTFYDDVDFGSLNLPVVFDSYYHTIKSDGTRCLIVLKH